MTISFETTPEEFQVIGKIVDRAEVAHRGIDRMTLHMDIAATHANGCPLKLVTLLDADDFDFNHDVFGIHNHIDRETGHLRDCFLPRHAAR